MALVRTTYRIAIPIVRDQPPSTATQTKGRALERLATEFLRGQSYTVVERFRDAGTEIDLLCRNKLTGANAVVECKAHDRTLQSEVINKLYTDVSIYDAQHGWLLSTSEVGAEARTRLQKINELAGSERYKFFGANELIPVLLDAGALVAPFVRKDQLASAEITLVLWEGSYYWTRTALDRSSSRPAGNLCWNASSGEPLDPDASPDLSNTDFPTSELTWLAHDRGHHAPPAPKSQPVVEVISGEEWSDYRPSRPDDFVGREALIGEVSEFFDLVVRKASPTRILGIKGRSGWGKSSLALKLADQMSNRKVYILPVDCRAANSAQYADLALARALTISARDRFIGPLFAPKFDFRANPLDEPSVRDFLYTVHNMGGVICVIFDQFEAIIHRSELRGALERMRELALFADEQRGPLVIGFSWKTDGTVGSDNPGYHLWHSLADRRRDFEVDRFTRDDAVSFISLAQRAAKTSLPRSVVNFILSQYAGFPWLLKKLVKHCIDDVKRSGNTANLNTFFNLSVLFDNDLQELSAAEAAAVRFIARDAPVELHVAEERCGPSAISALIDKRIAIKSGSHLSLYWDIFRDYVLHSNLPILPNTYVPTLSVRKIRSVIRLICSRSELSYSDLASLLGISEGTADNTVRDLSNIGLADSQRILGSFTSLVTNPSDATARIVEFLKSHTVYLQAKIAIDNGLQPTISDLERAVSDDYAFLSIDHETVRTYVRKIAVYCLEFGLLSRKGTAFGLASIVSNILEAPRRSAPLLDDEVFRGAAPPNRVIELLKELRAGNCTTLRLASEKKLRNAVYAASRLGLVIHREGRVLPSDEVLGTDDVERLVAVFASRVEPINSALSDLDLKSLSADEVGTYLSDLLELNWSPSSCRRYGFSLRDWGLWIEAQGLQV